MTTATDTVSAPEDAPGGPARIGILGGTGPMGSGLAVRLAAAGHEVLIGSREATRAAEVADGLDALWPGRGLSLRGVTNEAAVDADVVVLAAPWQAALTLAVAHEARLRRTVVISVANALTRVAGSFLPLTMPRGSVTAEVQALLPSSSVVGAFHHLPAGPLADLDDVMEADVLVCGDDEVARARVSRLVDGLEGLRPIDAGSLAGAGAVEAMTAVLVQVNVTYRTHSRLRLAGDFGRPPPAD